MDLFEFRLNKIRFFQNVILYMSVPLQESNTMCDKASYIELEKHRLDNEMQVRLQVVKVEARLHIIDKFMSENKAQLTPEQLVSFMACI